MKVTSRAAEVLREYAAMIEESETHHSGPLKGRCAPAIEEEVAEYRALADALSAKGATDKRPITRSSCACEVGDDDVFIEKCAMHSDWLKALLDIALCRMNEEGRRGAVTMDIFGPWARQRAAAAIPEDEYKLAVEALNATPDSRGGKPA